MDVIMLTALSKWMENTDLEEITWRSGKNKISLKTNNEPVESIIPSSPLQPVLAPAIGIFRSSQPGQTNALTEGMKLSQGSELGWIETGKTREALKAPCQGNLKIIAIKDGQPAEYGQPLFFIEPE